MQTDSEVQTFKLPLKLTSVFDSIDLHGLVGGCCDYLKQVLPELVPIILSPRHCTAADTLASALSDVHFCDTY